MTFIGSNLSEAYADIKTFRLVQCFPRLESRKGGQCKEGVQCVPRSDSRKGGQCKEGVQCVPRSGSRKGGQCKEGV